MMVEVKNSRKGVHSAFWGKQRKRSAVADDVRKKGPSMSGSMELLDVYTLSGLYLEAANKNVVT
jgi:hypothetical protein